MELSHDGDEEVGEARRAHLSQPGELPAVGVVEQQDAAAEHLALVDRPERPGLGKALRGSLGSILDSLASYMAPAFQA